MKTQRSLFLFIITGLLFVSACSHVPEGYDQPFDISGIERNNQSVTALTESRIFSKKVLDIKPVEGKAAVTIWKNGDPGNWSDASYLVFEVYGPNDYSGVINIEFYKGESSGAEKIILQSGELSQKGKESPWISCLMGIMPRIKTKIVFPLSYLDAQNLFVTRFPRQLKGTINGNRLDPELITRVDLRFGPLSDPWFTPVYELASVGLCDSLPEPYPAMEAPVIDRFGQRKDKDWPGKVHSDEELVTLNTDLGKSVTQATFPSEWSRFGGWKGKKFRATGFFRTENDGKRWWLVDPDGYAFLSVGVDCMRLTSSGPVDGMEDLFEWLPAGDDPEFAPAVSVGERGTNIDFYRTNLIRVHGKEWKEKWSSVTAGMMKHLGFNTVGNWSDISFARDNKLPYVLPLNRFPATKVLIYRDFPDVFSDEYRQKSVEFAEQLEDYKDDPYLVGYFLRNEPQWAFGYHNLAYEMFATSQESATKNEFVRWIGEKYNGNVQAFNKAWSTEIKEFSELKALVLKNYPSVAADSDFYAFSTIMVKRYIDIPCDEVDRIDGNHLNLGMRYAWLSSDLLYKAGERFDVFSINGYGYNPPPTAEIARISGKPVMIGEFHHGAVDRALPATGITGVISQDQRAEAYRNYIEQGFARPELIGMHYFQWVDQPFYGRFDGENYNIGVVDMNNLPYKELTEAMKITNLRIYGVGSGAIEPYEAEITRIPSIHY